MNEFIIEKNYYLKREIRGFYNTDYFRKGNPGNPNYINVPKNTYNSFSHIKLNEALKQIENILFNDIYEIYHILNLATLTVCVVPRSKANFQETQLYFLKAVKNAIGEILCKYNNKDKIKLLVDGTDYIKRHTNTYTTHLGEKAPNYTNDGPKPYPGITKDTCYISREVKDSHILLIDDIYTKNINIDEDAIQALFDNGAKSITFYAVAKTVDRRYNDTSNCSNEGSDYLSFEDILREN